MSSSFKDLAALFAPETHAPSFADLAGLLHAPAPAKGPPPGKRALKLAPGERRQRALEIREQYPSLHYDFAPAPSEPEVDPFAYDHILVAFSGGKDSLALVLLLLLMGVPRDRIELWHHEVDGGEDDGGERSTLMDWPCTPAYCKAIAENLGIRLYRSWKVGGFEREMTRHGAPTAAYKFELPDGTIKTSGGKSRKRSTRDMFPQKGNDLGTRWCSAYLKIMVMDTAVRNQRRFDEKRVLVMTGERAEESTGRAVYDIFEPHRTDLRTGQVPREVDHWRPLLGWPEAEVWKLMERFRVNPHPAYHLGWGRVSCAPCIFGSADQWASLRVVNPQQFAVVAAYEAQFGTTIDRERTVHEMADRGNPFPMMGAEYIRAALSREFTLPVSLDPWTLPHGALIGDGSGPT